MRHRIHVLLLAITILTPAVLSGASCGGDDDNACDGRILSTCTACTCEPGEQTTCTAYPRGDQNSNQRCCVCE